MKRFFASLKRFQEKCAALVRCRYQLRPEPRQDKDTEHFRDSVKRGNALEPREWGLIAVALALVADQGSKLLLLYGFGFVNLAPGEAIPVLPFFNMVMVWNPGISYGLFPASGLGTVLLIATSAVAVAVLGWLLWRSQHRSLAIGYGLIIGGALGNNLVDRVIYGKVADFFHFYGFGYDWYVFNVADLAITLGAVAIIYDVLKPEHAGKPVQDGVKDEPAQDVPVKDVREGHEV